MRPSGMGNRARSTGRDRQDVGEQSGRGGVGHKRQPACLGQNLGMRERLCR
jgi:hypothetical protein